ncbi:hypothetical protein CYY_007955 [Polysphondylium violaceum]|uniref:Uncharacterized protein n=1 Tax=Polysphondylium violaceum TaxID=133409 RepID=A0A8J4UXC2_9MYCE|nr:hypothetical protein CYY_007955 [Polysphondylium violaceum]
MNCRNKQQKLIFSHYDNLFPLIKKDFELFKILYSEYKYSSTRSIEDQDGSEQRIVFKSDFHRVVNTIQHIDAVKWMCNNGYGVELEVGDIVFGDESNPDVLEYLIQQGWYKVAYNSIICNHQKKNSVFTLPILEVFAKYTPTPITSEQVKEIIEQLAIGPIPMVFEILSPLFQDELCLDIPARTFACAPMAPSTLLIINYLYEKNLCKDITTLMVSDEFNTISKVSSFFASVLNIEVVNNGDQSIGKHIQKLIGHVPKFSKQTSEMIERNITLRTDLFSLPLEAIFALLDHGLQLSRHWFGRCIEKRSNHLFISLWNKLSSDHQLEITSNGRCILFYPNAKDRIRFHSLLHNWTGTNLEVLLFLIAQGMAGDELKRSIVYDFYRTMAKMYHHERDYKLIVELMSLGALECDTILDNCIKQRNISMFKYIYKHRVTDADNSYLLDSCIEQQDYQFLQVIESDNVKPNLIQSLNSILSFHRHEVRFIRELLKSSCTSYQTLIILLNTHIEANCFAVVKYLLTTFSYKSIKPFFGSLSKTTKPIIDLIYQNRDTIFSVAAPNASDWEHLLSLAIFQNNCALVEYFLHYKIVTSITISLKRLRFGLPSSQLLHLIRPLLSSDLHQEILDLPFISVNPTFHDIMYLIDHRVYESIDPYIDHIVSMCHQTNYYQTIAQTLEYISKNQHLFKQPVKFDNLSNLPLPQKLLTLFKDQSSRNNIFKN